MKRTALLISVVALAACAPGATAPVTDSTTAAPTATAGTAAVPTLATVATTTIPTVATTAPATTTTSPADPAPLQGITMTSVPGDVILPTSSATIDKLTNPINGRRSDQRINPGSSACVMADDPDPCLIRMLDTLGFDVSARPGADSERRLRRALAVVQLDAGLPMTGRPDDAVEQYLGVAPDDTLPASAREVRQLGLSQQGRPITAIRYGDGPRTVLVVGQTHGDEEGGLRVLLQARTRPPPKGVTLWVIPTMNPDGLAGDTRFLADGSDPNRKAVSEPEQQIVHDFALTVRPTLTVWYHQNYGWVGGSGASMAPARQYQELTGLGTLKHSGDCAVGFMWCPIDDALGSSSILVELPDVLTPADVRSHAQALLTVASAP